MGTGKHREVNSISLHGELLWLKSYYLGGGGGGRLGLRGVLPHISYIIRSVRCQREMHVEPFWYEISYRFQPFCLKNS